MLAVVGTVPDPDFPMVQGAVSMDQEGAISVAGHRIDVCRGTPALLASALQTSQTLGLSPPRAYLAGDIGLGHGSRRLYAYLAEHLQHLACDVLLFHYLQPDVDWHNKVLFAVQDMPVRPLLVADAGFMYAAKMSGQGPEYDLFTPDAGELAFLADETAPHPFYTRGFILHEENKVPDLIHRAYAHHNAARNLLVKGSRDIVADSSGILAEIDSPTLPALEAMGGTGDTVTGLVGSLLDSGMDMVEACRVAALVNRTAGQLTRPTPATQVKEIVANIPQGLQNVMNHEAELFPSGQ